jgi:Fe-S cluster assembly ATP-binding protein
MAPEERACDGVFMAFQYPVEIARINNAYFLKAALNAVRKHRGLQELDAVEFMQLIREGQAAGNEREMLHRSVNEGSQAARRSAMRFSRWPCSSAPGNSRRNRFRPRHRRAAPSHGVNALRSPERAIIVVTHYQRLLGIVPDFVRMLSAAASCDPAARARPRTRSQGLRLD